MDSPFETSSTSTNQFIENWDPLKDSYTPDQILERDDVIEQYRTYLQPVLDNGKVHNIFIRGPTGVGKTAITKRVLEFLKQDAAEVGIPFEFTYLNVQSQGTYDAVLSLANEIADEEFAKGTTLGQLRSAIYDAIDGLGGAYILVIDECDKLDKKGEDTFLYEFPRAQSNERITNTQVGVIGISNDLTYGSNLDPRIKSSLTEREIEFSPYNAHELESIVKYHADLALKDGCIDRSAVTHIAAKVANDTGDARTAIDLLELSVEHIRGTGDDLITDDHTKEAWDELDELKTVRRIRNILTMQQAVVLAVLARLDSRGETPLTVKEFYESYETILSQPHVDRETRHENSVRDHLNTLSMYGFAKQTEENAGKGGGRRFHYSLDIDSEYAVEGLSPFDEAGRIVLSNS
jgi:cell division control protein 6